MTMQVPLSAHRIVRPEGQFVEVWMNGAARLERAPLNPFYFTRADPRSLAHRKKVLGWKEEMVRPLSAPERREAWWRVECDTIEGVKETHEWEGAGEFAESHIGFLERILVDRPDWFRAFPHARPLRLLTFDIEQSVPEDGRMPARSNPLVSIAWACDVQGEAPGEVKWERAEVGARGVDDRFLINAFVEDWHRFDPDVVVGYNLDAYDLPVLVERMRLLGIEASSLCRAGSRGPEAPWKKEVGIAGGGNKKTREVTILPGRVVFDVLEPVRLDQMLFGIKNRKLKTVAEWMGLPALRITGHRPQDLLRDAPEQLRAYNVNDVLLTRSIGEGHFRNYLALADALGAPLGMILHATPSLYTTLLQAPVLREKGIVSDGQNRERFRFLYEDPACPKNAEGEARPVTGAYVAIHKTGLFRPLWKADFASMYPSIIIALGLGADNTRFLGWEDLGPPRFSEGEASLPDEAWGRNFRVLVEGRSPFAERVRALLATRYEKKALARELASREGTESAGAKAAKAEENALKVVLNSLYGSHASPSARYGSLAVGMTVTAVGRLLIHEAERLLTDSCVESDTDGVYVDRPPDLAALQEGIKVYARDRLRVASSSFRFDVDSYDGGYFAARKTYLLFKGGRVERHGQAFKASSRPALFDKVVEDLGLVLFREGEKAAYARALHWQDLSRYGPEDFVLRLRVGKSEYDTNTLGAQLSRLVERKEGRPPPVGTQVEYVRTSRGLELASEGGWEHRIDKQFYLGHVGKAVELLGLESARQKTLASFFG